METVGLIGLMAVFVLFVIFCVKLGLAFRQSFIEGLIDKTASPEEQARQRAKLEDEFQKSELMLMSQGPQPYLTNL